LIISSCSEVLGAKYERSASLGYEEKVMIYLHISDEELLDEVGNIPNNNNGFWQWKMDSCCEVFDRKLKGWIVLVGVMAWTFGC
jgi:hypothetical protein